MAPADILVWQSILVSLGMILSLMAILGTLVQARTRVSLFDRYGFALFGIYHAARYGERRSLRRKP